MNKQLKIDFLIKKEQQKQFLKVYFDVPDNVEAMTISYTYDGDDASSVPGESKNVIDLALLDTDGNDVGATGSSSRKITLSESYSSPGYKKLSIKQGNWCIICGAYMVRGEELTVKYIIDFKLKEYRYLKGDTHTHSVHSDGVKTITELGYLAIKEGLDFIISTDHNNFAHNKNLPDMPNLTIIPGVELTHYNGHVNIWGKETPYSGSFAVNSFEDFKSLIEQARKNGAIISLNHPFCSICPWKWDLDFYFDTLEVWNGPMRSDNLKTIEWWHKELLNGRKLPIVGGSDYHHNYLKFIAMFARPTMRVYSQSNTAKDILDAIKKGRSVITANAKSSMIYMTSGDSVVGDTVKIAQDTKVFITVDKLKRGHTLYVNNQNGVLYSYKAKKTSLFKVEFDIKEKGFIQAEIKCKAKGVAKMSDKVIKYLKNKKDVFKKTPPFIYAITNPIYFEN